ncbi:MAG TPA: MFS transporter [Actinocrinis sp.]|nr:MFS transporter [Actinocrinis sp.]
MTNQPTVTNPPAPRNPPTAPDPPGPVPPLRRNRDFLLLWSGAAVSNLGSNASSVAYPLLVLALTRSPADAGLTGFVALLPQLLFQLPAGALADRWNRKRVMVWCDLLRALALGSLAASLLWWRLSLAQILVVGVVEGTLTVCYRIAASAAVPNVVHPSQLTLALSRNEARTRGAAMVGQPLGGALFGVARSVPFLFDACSYVVSLSTLLLIKADFQVARKPTAPARPAALVRDIREGVAWLWGHSFLRVTTLLIAGSNLMFQALFLAVIVLVEHGGARPTAIGLMFGIAAVGGVLGSMAAPAMRKRLSMRAVVVGANWAWAVLVPLVALPSNPYAIGALYALMCFVGPVWNIVVSAYQLTVTPDAIRGRVLGASSLIAFGAIPLGSLLGGLMLDRFGARPTVWALTAWMLLLALAATVSRAVRHAPDAAPAPEPEPEPEAEPEPEPEAEPVTTRR